jgi:hypothetical protein
VLIKFHENQDSNTRIIEALDLQFVHGNQNLNIRIIEVVDLQLVHHTCSIFQHQDSDFDQEIRSLDLAEIINQIAASAITQNSNKLVL